MPSPCGAAYKPLSILIILSLIVEAAVRLDLKNLGSSGSSLGKRMDATFTEPC